MITREEMDKYPEVDWNVYKSQNNISAGPKKYENIQSESENIPIGPKSKSQKNPMINTFMGPVPDITNPEVRKQFTSPEMISEMIGMAAGGPGVKLIGKGLPLAKKAIGKGVEYLHPEREAERFRETLGKGTSSENIEELSKRAQFAKQSTKEQALIPKNKLYEQEGKSDIYKISPSKLPEGNINKLSYMIAPSEQYNESQAKALSKALSKYRKTGDIEHFTDSAENIFNIPELSEKAAEKVENALSLPTSRSSKYFADKDVSKVYSPRGKLMELHHDYEKNTILSNYDALQSALKKELREMESRAKISDTAVPKVEQLKANISNLDKDKEAFTQTLPENMKNLENEFRNKYRQYAQVYEKGNKETGSSLTLRRLAEGRHDLITDSQITKLFAHPTVSDQKAILDMGEGAARNAIYSALQRVPIGDAKEMANTVLDLKRTKGFDKIITLDMENWAHNMLSHVSRANMIKNALKVGGGFAAGSVMGGPVGGMIGASLPFAAKGAMHIAKALKK